MNSDTVFADTSYYLAALRAEDFAHARAIAESKINRPVITSEFVFLELGNALSNATDLSDFVTLVKTLRESPRVEIVPLSSNLFDSGLRRMAERSDKDWSLIDCISFLIMEERGITEALSSDRHFEQAGFRALLR